MKRLRKATPFVVSLLLHLAVMLTVVLSHSGNGNGKSPIGEKEQRGGEEARDIIPKQVEVELVEAPPKTEEADVPMKMPEPQKPTEGLTDCEGQNWFGGIGIYQDDKTGRIDGVIEGYPAFKAGLRQGDVIISPPPGFIRGEVGTPVNLTVQKMGDFYAQEILLIRDKICTGPKR